MAKPPNNANILSALKDTISKSAEDILSVVKEGASAIGDTEVLAEIPLISVPIKLLKIKDAFHEARLKRNVVAFLKNGLSDLEQKRALGALSFADSKQADDFIDTLLTVLLEIEKPLKAEIIGNLFRNLAKGNIPYSEFDELSLYVIAASIPMLSTINCRPYESRHYDRRTCTSSAAEEALAPMEKRGLLHQYGFQEES